MSAAHEAVSSQAAVARQQLAQSQQIVEQERLRTLEIQSEVERQVCIKQKELSEAEALLFKEREFVKSQSMELERRFNEFRADAERRVAAQQEQIDIEKQMRIDTQHRLLAVQVQHEQLLQSVKESKRPEDFRLDMFESVNDNHQIQMSDGRSSGFASVIPAVPLDPSTGSCQTVYGDKMPLRRNAAVTPLASSLSNHLQQDIEPL